MAESKVMMELRQTRDRISEEIKEMSIEQIKEYVKKSSDPLLKEILEIRKKELESDVELKN